MIILSIIVNALFVLLFRIIWNHSSVELIERRDRMAEKMTIKKKTKKFILDVIMDIIGGTLIAVGTYNFAAFANFPMVGLKSEAKRS